MKWLLLLLVITGIAAFLRFFSLDRRPMHTDEAVHGMKFGQLLEEGFYRYDKHEYHGPTLNYLTLVPALLLSQQDLREVNEITLRMIPALFGTSLVLLLLAVLRYMKPFTLIFAALFLAISPVLVFYSRYYIQEILLVFFTFSSLVFVFRWLDTGRRLWAIVTGISFGMMFATKETWIVALAAIFVSAVPVFLSLKKNGKISIARTRMFADTGLIMILTVLTGLIFYSSFFSNPQGIPDAVASYSSYFKKAGDFEKHIHPWHYYLMLLVTGGKTNGFWTEAFLLIAGSAGLVFSISDRHEQEGRFFLFIATFSVLTTLVYSILPYKTPWNLLTWYTGWILLSGYGCGRILQISRHGKLKYLVYFLVFSGTIHLLYQTILLNFKYEADGKNPWVYGHTDRDIFRLVETVEKIIGTQPAGSKMSIEVIAAGHDYWPLPWYFRKYPNTGWWDHVDRGNLPAPVIIASPEFETAILQKIYELPPPGQRHLYLPMFDTIPSLRPGVYLEGYVRKDVWDSSLREQ